MNVEEALEVFRAVHLYIFATALGRRVEVVPNSAFVAEVIAHAQLHGMMHMIARPLRLLVHQQQNPDWLEDIVNEPLFYLGLGSKLQAPAIWCIAMKHCVGGGYFADAQCDDLRRYLIDDESVLVASKLAYRFGSRLTTLNQELLSSDTMNATNPEEPSPRSFTLRSLFSAEERTATKQVIAQRLVSSLTSDWMKRNVVYNTTYNVCTPALQGQLHHNLHMRRGCAYPYMNFLNSDVPDDLVFDVMKYQKRLGLKKNLLLQILTRHMEQMKAFIKDFLQEAPSAPSTPLNRQSYFTNFVCKDNAPFMQFEEYVVAPPPEAASTNWLKYVGLHELADNVEKGSVRVGTGTVVIKLPQCTCSTRLSICP